MRGPMASPQSKKRKFLSLEQKAEIIAAAAAGRKKGLIAQKYGTSPSSLSTILKSEASISKALASGIINSVKRAYRSRLIQRILLNTKHGRDTKVDLFMAVQMLAAAWMSTRREVVKNCFAHAGFRPEEMSLGSSSDDAQAADDVGRAQDEATAAAWEALEEASIVPENVALSDYVNADADVIVYEELSDAEILKSARAAADSSDDEVGHDVPKVPTPVTASQVMDSLDIIRSFLGTHDDDVAMQLLTECEQRILPLLHHSWAAAKCVCHYSYPRQWLQVVAIHQEQLHAESLYDKLLLGWGVVPQTADAWHISAKSCAQPSPFTHAAAMEQHCVLTLMRASTRAIFLSVFVSQDLHDCSHVFVQCDQMRPPLTPAYDGPFRILHRTPKTFTLDINGREDVVAANRLKPAYIGALVSAELRSPVWMPTSKHVR
ncbi:hypothetical protein HPB50_014616 [Hyalomma asiaticum]|uniref:Uncharacterized protein n=1 Tax=Hyalomma asiaticum TaxID=266040 RepID=A0ACB7TMW8_HYAAI|nr:hypothetical protein HPB50_014616 [Hyalomma asiaticum]